MVWHDDDDDDYDEEDDDIEIGVPNSGTKTHQAQPQQPTTGNTSASKTTQNSSSGKESTT